VGRIKNSDRITAALLQWGSSELRDLPWRRASDPWHVLVSEVMLQQTSVTRVLSKFEFFIETYPTPHALATSSLGEALSLWQGLGYPRRCRNLRDAAIVITDTHDGVVPNQLEALLALPGVGPYTARAVLAFAYRRDVAVVDVNVSRVFSRLRGEPMTAKQLQDMADALVPPGLSWEWNQVLMELGGRVCTARSPRCTECPIRKWCTFMKSKNDIDPASLSAGASKPQPRFEGSDRQLRGAVLRIVLDTSHKNRSHTMDDILLHFPDSEQRIRVEKIMIDLVDEGLLVRRGQKISAP
jgi:A/G-specific adenine glycosylase